MNMLIKNQNYLKVEIQVPTIIFLLNCNKNNIEININRYCVNTSVFRCFL